MRLQSSVVQVSSGASFASCCVPRAFAFVSRVERGEVAQCFRPLNEAAPPLPTALMPDSDVAPIGVIVDFVL